MGNVMHKLKIQHINCRASTRTVAPYDQPNTLLYQQLEGVPARGSTKTVLVSAVPSTNMIL